MQGTQGQLYRYGTCYYDTIRMGSCAVTVHAIMIHVHCALVCTKKGRRDGNSNSEKEKRGGKNIFLLSFLPPNFLLIFISFYCSLIWTHFILCFFFILFIFAASFIIFALFTLFCHGDGYKHTPNWHAPRRRLHDLSTILGGWGWIVVAIPFVLHKFCVGVLHTSSCGFVYLVFECGRLFCSTPSVQSSNGMTLRSWCAIYWLTLSL
jgi:hypothetical protein